MHCLNCSSFHAEEVLLCKSCRLPLWNLVAAVQKCGSCGKRWSMHDSGCENCQATITVTEAIQVTVIEVSSKKNYGSACNEELKINKEISAIDNFCQSRR